MKKKITIIIGTVVLSILIFLSGYWFHSQKLKMERRIYLKGQDDAVAAIIIGINSMGKFTINTEQGPVVLVAEGD